MDDFVVLARPSEFVDISARKGTAGKRTSLVSHRPNLLYLIIGYIVSLASIGRRLVIEIPTKYVDVLIVEADRVRRAGVFHLVAEHKGKVLEIHLEDRGRFLAADLSASHHEQISVGNCYGFVVIRQFVTDVEWDLLELVALIEVQIVQFVLIVLEEVEIASWAAIAEGVHADYFFFGRLEALLAGLPGVIGTLIVLFFLVFARLRLPG